MYHEERVHHLASINALSAQYASVVKLEDKSCGHQSQSGEVEVFSAITIAYQAGNIVGSRGLR